MTATVVPLRPATTFARAVDRFLANGDLTPSSRRVYDATFTALLADLGPDRDVASITTDEIERHLRDRYGRAAPATYNRNRATVGSLYKWLARKRLVVENPIAGVDRRKARKTEAERRRADVLTYEELKRIWSAPTVSLRERTLWTMAYETGARANELLNLDVEDLDLDERRAFILGKGGHAETAHWATPTARLLPRLIAGRTTGPLFLTDRRSRQPTAAADLDRDTNRARLSYRRAAELFRDASRGRTLHEIRHARITHLIQDGVDIALVAAKSRHTTLRSLERYVHPTEDDVALLTARHDPEARRRQRRA